jgi:hypothetical protein
MIENLVRGFICIFQTKKIGRIPKAQSVTALIAACAYVTFDNIGSRKQVPCPPSYFVQRKLIGEHCKRRKKKYIVLNSMTTPSVM